MQRARHPPYPTGTRSTHPPELWVRCTRSGASLSRYRASSGIPQTRPYLLSIAAPGRTHACLMKLDFVEPGYHTCSDLALALHGVVADWIRSVLAHHTVSLSPPGPYSSTNACSALPAAVAAAAAVVIQRESYDHISRASQTATGAGTGIGLSCAGLAW